MSGLSRALPRSVALLLVTLLFSFVAAAPWGSYPGPFYQPNNVHITSVTVDIVVPDVPASFTSKDTIFIWPAVQPGNGLQDGDPEKIGNGMLVPSLTFGSSCAPGAQPRNSWWIAGQYYNVPAHTDDPEFAGCHGGDIMAVQPGEIISCNIVNAQGSVWEQVCTRPSGESVSYTINMKGQQMNWASLVVMRFTERVNSLWNFPIYFYNYRFTTSAPMPSEHCIVPASGDDFITQGSRLSSDRLSCSLDAVVFWNPAYAPPKTVSLVPPK